MSYELKDSGVREEFTTGSRRDTQEGKPRFDLIPVEALKAYAVLLAKGAGKYGERNWEKGQPLSRLMASAMRHLFAATSGQNDEDHLAAVLFNVGAIIHHLNKIGLGELPEELMDVEWADPLIGLYVEPDDGVYIELPEVSITIDIEAERDAAVDHFAAIRRLLAGEE